MKRTLTLTRETLTELTTDELVRVAGAVAAETMPVNGCISGLPSFAQHTCVDCITRQNCE